MRAAKTAQSNKRAFTLVEILIALALVVLVGAILASMIVPGSNLLNSISQNTTAKMKADQVMAMIVYQVRFADELSIYANPSALPSGPDANTRYLYCVDGKVFMNDGGSVRNVYTDDFYYGYAIDISAERLDDNLLRLTCVATFESDSSIRYELTTSVQAYNVQAIDGVPAGSALSYRWITGGPPTAGP